MKLKIINNTSSSAKNLGGTEEEKSIKVRASLPIDIAVWLLSG